MAKISVRDISQFLAKNLIVEDALVSLRESLLASQKAHEKDEDASVKNVASDLDKSIKDVLTTIRISVASAVKAYNEAVSEENKAVENLHKAVFAEEKKNEEV